MIHYKYSWCAILCSRARICHSLLDKPVKFVNDLISVVEWKEARIQCVGISWRHPNRNSMVRFQWNKVLKIPSRDFFSSLFRFFLLLFTNIPIDFGLLLCVKLYAHCTRAKANGNVCARQANEKKTNHKHSFLSNRRQRGSFTRYQRVMSWVKENQVAWMQRDRKLFFRLNEWVSVCVSVYILLDILLILKYSLLNLFVRVLFLWRSSVSRLHTFIIFIFPLLVCADSFSKQLGKLFRYVCAFSLFFFFAYTPQSGEAITQQKSHFETDCSATTRSQGVKSKQGNNKNYLFLYHMLGHSAERKIPTSTDILGQTKHFNAGNSNSKCWYRMIRCREFFPARNRKKWAPIFRLSTSIDKLPTKDTNFKCCDSME